MQFSSGPALLPCSIPVTRPHPPLAACALSSWPRPHILSPRRRRQPRCTVAMLTHCRRWPSNLIVLHFASTMAVVSEQCNLASISVRPGRSRSGIGARPAHYLPIPAHTLCLVCVVSPSLPHRPVQPGASKSGATVLHNHGRLPSLTMPPPLPHTIRHPPHTHQTKAHAGQATELQAGMDRGDLAQLTQWPITSPGPEQH